MSSSNNEQQHDPRDNFFEESTIGIGFLYTIIALGVIVTIYFFG